MNGINNIILIGFMGSGKTYIGSHLAEKLNFNFYDTDEMIEKESQSSIQHIFATKGEACFRQLESTTIQRLIGKLDHAILSTGGGLPITEGNPELLRQLGKVVFLKTSRDIIKVRLAGDTTRPLLSAEDSDNTMDALLKFRTPIYEATAHIIVNTDNKSVETIVEEISSKVMNI